MNLDFNHDAPLKLTALPPQQMCFLKAPVIQQDGQQQF
jgi:hypothetical protein